MLTFEVQAKYGRGWRTLYVGLTAVDSRAAARHASYVHNRKAIRVRPEDSRGTWFVYRFLQVPTLAAA